MDSVKRERQRLIAEELQAYAKQRVAGILKPMLHKLFLETPDDPVQFMIEYLSDLKETESSYSIQSKSTMAEDAESVVRDHLDALPVMGVVDGAGNQAIGRFNRRRRVGVSAEPMNVMEDQSLVPDVIVPKTDQDRQSIRKAISDNLLFKSLSEDELSVVIDAMEEKHFKAGDFIIRQGEEGNHFYVLEKGECECFVNINGEEKMVKHYSYGESFGELALMYNTPRAASIQAKTDVSVWAMGRLTFRKVLFQQTSSKRKKYEEVLQKVSLLESLDKYDRSKIADALIDASFKAGDCIIAEGDRGNNLFILVSGEAVARKEIHGKVQDVFNYEGGSYFGELALLHDKPRQASIFAVTDCQCVTLDRAAFNRLLGPLQQHMNRKKEEYREAEKKITVRRRGGVSAAPIRTSASQVFIPTQIPKDPEQIEAIKTAIANNFLFNSLEQEQLQIVINAMSVKEYAAGEDVITQGDDGDDFYVLDKGECECYLKLSDNPEPIMVKEYSHGESFGELALMYNTPRAATIRAKTACVVFGMDRNTFQHVIMEAAQRKRKMYEGFLASVELLSSLDNYERGTIADALESVSYKDGENIIVEGEPGDHLYFIEQGEAEAIKTINGERKVVYAYAKGGFFGERALIKNEPRAATIVAVGDVKCARLDRSSVERLLGSIQELLHDRQAAYSEIESKIQSEAGSS